MEALREGLIRLDGGLPQRGNAMFDDKGISMKEKMEVLRNDQRVRATYHSFTQADAETEIGGRFSKVQPTTVTGSTPGPVYPQQPLTSPANKMAMMPEERPLGFSVEEDRKSVV